MADAVTITLPAPLADDLRSTAEACEQPVEDHVRTVLARDRPRARTKR